MWVRGLGEEGWGGGCGRAWAPTGISTMGFMAGRPYTFTRASFRDGYAPPSLPPAHFNRGGGFVGHIGPELECKENAF